jgi:hypothetical protein
MSRPTNTTTSRLGDSATGIRTSSAGIACGGMGDISTGVRAYSRKKTAMGHNSNKFNKRRVSNRDNTREEHNRENTDQDDNWSTFNKMTLQARKAMDRNDWDTAKKFTDLARKTADFYQKSKHGNLFQNLGQVIDESLDE